MSNNSTFPPPPVRKTKHRLDESLAPHGAGDGSGLAATRIALVGAGGTGSQMVPCLARMDRALRALHLPPLHVTLYDADLVSAANVGRLLFYPDDVGQSKAVLLIHRANLGFGLAWEAAPVQLGKDRPPRPCDVLITCVDTGAARREILAGLDMLDPPAYWLDVGNEASTGQVWLGQFPRLDELGTHARGGQPLLPRITEAFPRFFDGTEPETDAPSCSLAEALETQDLFVNDHCARWASHLLWTLLRRAEIEHHGYWINLRDGSVAPVPVTILEEGGAA